MQLHNEPRGIAKKVRFFTFEDKKYTVLLSNKEEINRIHFFAPLQIYYDFSSTSRMKTDKIQTDRSTLPQRSLCYNSRPCNQKSWLTYVA